MKLTTKVFHACGNCENVKSLEDQINEFWNSKKNKNFELIQLVQTELAGGYHGVTISITIKEEEK